LRRLALNLVTASATVLLLAGLTLPAKRILDGPDANANLRPPPRAFGVYVDPWHVDDWAKNLGAAPQMVAKFEAFSKRRTLEDFVGEAERQGIGLLLITWEPWKPVPTALGTAAQLRPQIGYRNADIAAGWQDEYIKRFARSLAAFDGIVYLRYAHEMNGSWYPWSNDWNNYRRAWRHVVTVIRSEGAHNVRFVWSVNLNLYQARRAWFRRLPAYWPGARYVDAIGATVINFGIRKRYAVRRFVPRLEALHRFSRKPVMITEFNTQYAGRVQWLRNLRRMLRRMPWIKAVAWSQLPSRGKAHLAGVGELDWDVQRDPAAAAVLRQIIRDGSGLKR
jgi:hypothetical protein